MNCKNVDICENVAVPEEDFHEPFLASNLLLWEEPLSREPAKNGRQNLDPIVTCKSSLITKRPKTGLFWI